MLSYLIETRGVRFTCTALTSWPPLRTNTYQIYLKATREFSHHSITTQNDVKYKKWVFI